MVLGAALENPMTPSQDEGFRGVLLVVHIVLVLAGYAALFFTALSAVAYLMQERRLKSKQGSALLERLPPLATLDGMLTKSLGLGFAFLTLGLIFAVMWVLLPLAIFQSVTHSDWSSVGWWFVGGAIYDVIVLATIGYFEWLVRKLLWQRRQQRQQ
jgi:ABC-type uncharacterized transport system permease subunit